MKRFLSFVLPELEPSHAFGHVPLPFSESRIDAAFQLKDLTIDQIDNVSQDGRGELLLPLRGFLPRVMSVMRTVVTTRAFPAG